MPFAVWRDFILLSTGNEREVIGLNQIYRTEPDIMIAFSVALEITPGLFEQALYLGGKIVRLTRLGEGVTLGEKVEGNARMFAAGDNAVLPQQLRNHNLKLSLKFFRSLGLSNKPWHVVA
jgi:hypothetical protein